MGRLANRSLPVSLVAVALALISWALPLQAQSPCLHEPGTWSFNKVERWSIFPGTERAFLEYWALHPDQREALVGFWQKLPTGNEGFPRHPRRIAPRIAILRDCGFDGWDYVAVSVYQQGEGSERLADVREILFALRSSEEPDVFDIRFPRERERPSNEARLDDDKLLIVRARTVEQWSRR